MRNDIAQLAKWPMRVFIAGYGPFSLAASGASRTPSPHSALAPFSACEHRARVPVLPIDNIPLKTHSRNFLLQALAKRDRGAHSAWTAALQDRDPASQMIGFQLSVGGRGILGETGQHGALIGVEVSAGCMRSIKRDGKAVDWIGGWNGENRPMKARR